LFFLNQQNGDPHRGVLFFFPILSHPLTPFNEEILSQWIYAANETQIENAWLAGYGSITNANIVENNIDKFSSENQGSVNRIKAQALAIRALVYFDLMRYFVDDYNRNSTSPGIPYKTVLILLGMCKR